MENIHMDDQELLRYSRQIMLPEIDAEGQLKLANATVMIIGLGGLGSSASIYLSAGGVGHLVLVDFDRVDLSNLQRQILHSTADIGRPKVESARDRLMALNDKTRLTCYDHALEGDELINVMTNTDVVVDASDNFRTRFAVNEACVSTCTPLVSGAAIRFESQVSVFDSRDPESPCYRCLYHEEDIEDETCTANGVLSPLLGIIGSIQATEAMKLIMGIGKSLKGNLLLFDVLHMDIRQAKLAKDPQCPVCANT